MNIAVIGATGLVGHKMLQVIEEQGLNPDRLIAAASERSIGKKVCFKEKNISVVSVEDAIAAKPDIAIFSAGSEASLLHAPRLAHGGTFVIDNSSAWRRDNDVPLVVPEINASDITVDTRIIANPNCSTIALVMALAPLHRRYKIRRIVVSTYQSVSGSGMKGLGQLHCEQQGGISDNPAYPHRIHENVIPQGGSFIENGYTTEEDKLIFETNKILHSDIAVTATVVRVPVYGGHSEAVNIEFEQTYDLNDAISTLKAMPGVVICDNPEECLYPMPVNAYDKDEVFVGRIRRDFSIANGLNLWLCSDNIRKGAATNAVQIAKYLIDKSLV